mmetsp:Transcript_8762/g.18177  ORF Transcript_8762/g.18177 Transcript_8762/m.18177 type:complete len:378 (-) Transcript_8762:145-1278(-)
MGGRVSGNALKVLAGEKTDSNNSPSTVGEVDRDGIDSVIDLHLDEEFGESVVDQSTDKSNDDSGPWLNNGASSSDGNKTTKGSIHGHSQIIRGFSGLLGFHETVESHGTDTSAGSSEGGGDSAKSGSSGRSFVGNGQSRSWVESVPSEPKDESSKDLKGSGVSWEFSRGFEGVSVFIVESSSARSKDGSSNKSGGSSSHVDNARSGEVNGTNTQESIFSEGSQKSISRPDGADDNWVDKCSKEKRVEEVGNHLAAFGNSSGDNGGGGGSEGELEEKSNEFRSRGEARDGKGSASDEGTSSSVRETVSKSVETNGSTTGIQQVLEHDILDILLTDRTGTEHGETGLHQKDESSCEKQEEGVNSSGHGVGGRKDGTGGG